MKLITYSKIGYNAPSGANWCYGIWKIDMIDTERGYCATCIVKENFGGDYRFKNEIATACPKGLLIQPNGVHTSTGTPKITGVQKMQDIESKEFINYCIEFLNN